MRRTRFVIGALILATMLIAALAPAAAAAPSSGGAFVVGFKSLPRDLRSGDRFHGARVERVDRALHFARVRASNSGMFRAQTAQDNRVRYVEPDPVRKLIEFTPNDPQYPQQYGPQHIRAPEAWDTTLGDTDAAVCVVDTGVRSTHEDLAGSRWRGGYDFVNGDADPADDNGHGTHVAGSAAAWINNAKGIAGVGNVALNGVKVLNAQGSGSWSAVASGIRWCADNGGPRVVINMSLGGPPATVLQDAVTYAYGRGALLVAAAGNSGPCTNCIDYPANYAEVIAVTCTTSTKVQCSFSSDGPDSELAAPGQSIRSVWNTSDTAYNTISGTSMSTPHVAGAAALVWSNITGMTNAQLRQHLRDEAQDLGPAGWDEQFGYGLVDAKATLDAAAPPPPPAPESRVTFENFDDGVAQGWSLTALWHVSSRCSTPPSVPNYLGYNEDSDCQYSTGARTTGSATFDVNLTGKTQGTLNLSHRFEKELGGGVYDILRIQVSTNGGGSWTTLRQWDSRNANQLAWTNHSVDLDPYTGGAIKLRFFFDSLDGYFNNYAGWFLDNVEVTAGPVNQPPQADAGPDQVVADDDGSGNEAVTLNGTGSSDADGTITSYQWREGAALLATGATPTVTFGVGTHTVTLTVTDDDQATDTDTVIITVSPNQAPTARFTYTTSGLTVNVNGSTSSDPDGTITNYSWNWGDGTPTGSGAAASHTYAAPGAYTVTLTVTDNGGATNSTSQLVTVGESRVTFENFDDGVAQGWSLTGLWHVSSACSTPPSVPNYLGYNEDSDCQFSTGARTTGSATFDVNLTGKTRATLNLAHRFEKELGSGVYDILRIQVSTNGGGSWTTLRQWDSRNANQLAWTNHSVDLDPYTGGAIKLRFFFDSLDGYFNNYAGWFLDNVEVTAN